VEQRREPMNKNRMRGLRQRASGHMTAKPISIKTAGGKSGGCALKAVGSPSGDLLFVPESGLRVGRPILTGRQKSAAGIVAWIAWETRQERRPKRSPQGVNGNGE